MNDLKETLDHHLSTTQWTEENTENVLLKIKRDGSGRKKAIPGAMIAAIILLLFTMATVVADSKWGVLDWLSSFSDQPTAPIETARPALWDEKTTGQAIVMPVEAVTDGYGMYVSVLCTPAEPDTLLLNPSLNPNLDTVEKMGIPGDQTIAAWAKDQGIGAIQQIYIFSAAPQLASFDARVSASMRLTEDGSSLIMLAGSNTEKDEFYDLTYRILPYVLSETDDPSGEEWVLAENFSIPIPQEQIGTLRFSVTGGEVKDAKILASYRPEEIDPASFIQIQRVDLVRSTLADYYDVTYTLPKGENHDEWMPVFGISAEEREAFAYSALLMHGRRERILPDGSMEYSYICRTVIHDLPDAIGISGIAGWNIDSSLNHRVAVKMVRQDDAL